MAPTTAKRKPNKRRGAPVRLLPTKVNRPTRQQVTIDVQHFPQVRRIIRREALKRQYVASEPFLRRILALLFLEGHLEKLPL